MRNLSFRELLALPRGFPDVSYSDYISSVVNEGVIDTPLSQNYQLYEDKIFSDINVGILVDDYTDCRGTDIFVLTYLGKDACFIRSAGRGWEYCDCLVIDECYYESMVSYIVSTIMKHQMGGKEDTEVITDLDLDSSADAFLRYYGSQWGLKEDSKVLERIG